MLDSFPQQLCWQEKSEEEEERRLHGIQPRRMRDGRLRRHLRLAFRLDCHSSGHRLFDCIVSLPYTSKLADFSMQ